MTAPARRLHIALLGTRGVPARYGGFETCVEEVGRRLADRGHRVTVYCRAVADEAALTAHLGMQLVHLPAARRRSLETLTHTGLSVGHLLGRALRERSRPDAALVFNSANAPWLPVLRAAGIPVATHVDGLEWKRAKWGSSGRRYYRMAETLAVRWSDALIADARGIQDYYRREFDADTTYLTYGAPLQRAPGHDLLTGLNLEPGRFHLAVARFEPENHLHLIIEGYVRSTARLPLVVVGSAPYSREYTRRLHELADPRVRFTGGLWDQALLDQLYANALVYWHGHSVGGTNPSLLRAMGAGAPTNAFDVDFNREVLGGEGRYFLNPIDVCRLAEDAEAAPSETVLRGKLAQRNAEAYDWDEVAQGYERLCVRLADRRVPARRPSGRRLTTDEDA